uniref:RNA transcription, translation and transport factor protein n=1 Tax=Oncorhynchus tshawytscha TaxID=74940 RepID=A0A8C8FQF5_ONCTS
MFRRKLTALDYHNPSGFDCNDETEFRNFIVWLEDQKIRHYKIEDRGNLRNIPSSEWPKSFEQYLQDVNCPFSVQERQESVDWLLGLAVRFEYGDNVEKYKNCPPATATKAEKPSDPLIHLDSNNPDFKAGVMGLANMLKIQRHDDYLVMLKAIRILIQERLTPEAIAKARQSKEWRCRLWGLSEQVVMQQNRNNAKGDEYFCKALYIEPQSVMGKACVQWSGSHLRGYAILRGRLYIGTSC